MTSLVAISTEAFACFWKMLNYNTRLELWMKNTGENGD